VITFEWTLGPSRSGGAGFSEAYYQQIMRGLGGSFPSRRACPRTETGLKRKGTDIPGVSQLVIAVLPLFQGKGTYTVLIGDPSFLARLGIGGRLT
jgi:hypothetical protein